MTPVIQMFHSNQCNDAISVSTTNFGSQNMTDWVEGWLEMKKKLQTIHELMLKNNHEEAKETLIELAAIARMTSHQLSIQYDSQAKS